MGVNQSRSKDTRSVVRTFESTFIYWPGSWEPIVGCSFRDIYREHLRNNVSIGGASGFVYTSNLSSSATA